MQLFAAFFVKSIMVPYANKQGDSGVTAYETAPGSILVQFIGGDTYLYTNDSAGAINIKQMKHLAERGSGLSTFISQYVKDAYERKLNS